MTRWKLDYPAKFVAPWEGEVLTAYLDTIANPAVWTIAYGHTGPIRDPRTGRLRSIREGDQVSRRYALRLLASDLRFASREVARLVDVPLTIRQRMALISLLHNIGAGAFASSTLLRKLNAGDYRAAANEFLKWKFAGGQVIPGLLNRRRAERWMFTHPKKGKR